MTWYKLTGQKSLALPESSEPPILPDWADRTENFLNIVDH